MPVARSARSAGPTSTGNETGVRSLGSGAGARLASARSHALASSSCAPESEVASSAGKLGASEAGPEQAEQASGIQRLRTRSVS